jgi:dual-specificity kinase
MKRLEVSSCPDNHAQPLLSTSLQDIIPSNNRFMQLFLDLLRKIFVYDPNRRITAKQALQHPWFKEIATADDGSEAAKLRMERVQVSSGATRLPAMHQRLS